MGLDDVEFNAFGLFNKISNVPSVAYASLTIISTFSCDEYERVDLLARNSINRSDAEER